jgi:hypothetical protein
MKRKSKRRGNKTDTYNRALRVWDRIEKGETPTAAARAEHIDLRTVKKNLGAEFWTLLREKHTRRTKPDRLDRAMRLPTARGISPVVVHGSNKASLLGRYMSAVGHYLRTGDTNGLNEFEGQSISGHRLITDPETLSSLAQAGALTLDEIYAMPESSS